MLGQERPYLLDGPGECVSGDAEQPGEQVIDADLAQEEDGCQNPVPVGELVLGARASRAKSLTALAFVAKPLTLVCQRRNQ